MHVNQTVLALALAKRETNDNADIDNKYEEAMEEIEERKKTCKVLEYAGHATDLVTNLIGDIPDIPLVTDTVKVVTSGVAAVAHVAEFGMNIAATALECDDVNFDEIKAIMDKRFSEIDRKLDKMSEAMEKVTEMVTKTLNSVEKTRKEMKWGFKSVLASLKNHEIQGILSKIDKFARYFEEKRSEISNLPLEQFVFRLKEKDGILDYLKKVRMPEGLHSDLFELMNRNNNFAIPESANDVKAFQALYSLSYGTQTYAAVMFFLLKQHSYLADYYYQKGEDKKFNQEFDTLITTFNEFKSSLTGNEGLINAVVKTLEEVKNKQFIKNVKDELYKDLSNRINDLKYLKTKIAKMVLNVIQDTPDTVLDIDFVEPHISSNYGDWDDGSKVRYAVQLRVDGIYSKFSEWYEPLKVDGKANPTLQVLLDEKERERLIFRRFNDEKPQLVGILGKSQEEFKDIDRDVYNAARSKDQTRPLEYIPKLLEANADIKARFEMNRTAMHAAAESGNAYIAMRFLLDKDLVNATDEKGFAPIHIAASTKNAGFVNFLITHHANVNVQTNVDKLTALHMAAKRGFTNTVENLIKNNTEIDVNLKEKLGYAPLHYAIRGDAKTIEALLGNDKIIINAKSEFGLTPFHLAIMRGDGKICDALLSSGKVEVNAGNKDNMTALHFAAMMGNVDMIKYLLSGKEEVKDVEINSITSNNNWTPLYTAIFFKQEGAALELLNNKNINVTIASIEKYTPLQLSIATGQMKIFDEILKKDSDLESLTKEMFTALHLAAMRSETTFTEKLLDKNANINAVAYDGSTPLHLASKSDQRGQVLLLIERGANMKLYDSKKFLPFQYAIKNVNLEGMRAAVEKDRTLIDEKTEEMKIITEYCMSFILESMYHYHKNKDSIEYQKYKSLEPLEIFDKMGYYDLLKIIQNDDKSTDNLTNGTMETFNAMVISCIKDEGDPKATQCIFEHVRSRRSMEDIVKLDHLQSVKLKPINFVLNTIHSSKNVNNQKSIEMKSYGSNNAFPNSKMAMVQGIDTNGMLLLFDLIVRKMTNEKYGLSVDKPMSALESQATALKITDKFASFVDSISDVPAEELMDLSKLHSDLYKAIEGEKGVKPFDILCENLRKVANGKVKDFLLKFKKEKSDDNNPGNLVNTIVQYCLSDDDKAEF